MTYLEGIDVSSWQREFNWLPWKNHIQFGLARASRDGSRDSSFAHNWTSMKEIGIHRFAYHFANPRNDVYDQVDLLFNTVSGLGLESGDNFVLDIEESGGLDPVGVSAWGREFCERMNSKAPGHRILVYTYPSFAQEGNCQGLNRWRLWIANYNVAHPTVPSPWTNWIFWQYTDQGPGNIDHDRFYGTADQLRKFCTTSGSYTR